MDKKPAEAVRQTESVKNIVLFTSNYQGGVFQFTLYLSEVIARQGFSVHVFMPDSASDAVSGKTPVAIHTYRRYRDIRPKNKCARSLAARIADCIPARVLFCDDSIISGQVIRALDKTIPATQFVHDVSPHPAWRSLYERLRTAVEKHYRDLSLKKAGQIVLLSKNSFEAFRKAYPKAAPKAVYMMLGAHLPEAAPVPPAELPPSDRSGYYLFFGRIDKYKGIINLLKAYELLEPAELPPLIIAGSGTLQEEEEKLIEKNGSILLINRFLDDAEMLYLIQNALTVVLPYTEASQSGVLPIACHFGVPVIVSDLQGLTEFVEDGESGLVFSDIEGLGRALLEIKDPAVRDRLGRGALKFSKERLDWDDNVRKTLKLT